MNHFKWISILNMNVANAKQQHNNTNTRKKRKMHIYTIRFCMRSNKGEKKNNGNINYIPDIVKFVTLSARHLTNKHKTILLQLFFSSSFIRCAHYTDICFAISMAFFVSHLVYRLRFF